jgi:ribosome-binding protein aMBF1 (putative translation factor)
MGKNRCRERRKAAGLCGHCGVTECDPSRICDGCRAEMREAARKRSERVRARKKADAAATQRRRLDTLRATCLARADVTRSRLTAARVARGLTGVELADLAYVHPSEISALETGRASPRWADGRTWRGVAIDLSRALDTTPGALWPADVRLSPALAVAS